MAKAPTQAKAATKSAAGSPKTSTRATSAKVTPRAVSRSPKAATQPAPKPTPSKKTKASPAVVTAKAVAAGPELKRNELIDRIAAATDRKRGDVKPLVEAVLSELGRALAAGEQLNLEPFGKVKVKSEKSLPNARVIEARIRQKKG